MAIKNYLVKNKKKNIYIFVSLIICISIAFVIKYVNNTNAGVFVKDENGNSVQINEIKILEIIAREGEQVLGYTVEGQEPISVSDIENYNGTMDMDVEDFKDATGYKVTKKSNDDGTFSYKVIGNELNTSFNDNVLGQSMSVGEIVINAVQANDLTVKDVDDADLIYINSNDYNNNLLYYYDQFVCNGKLDAEPGEFGEGFSDEFIQNKDKILNSVSKISKSVGDSVKVNDLKEEDFEFLKLEYINSEDEVNLSNYKECNYEAYKNKLASMPVGSISENISEAIPQINEMMQQCNDEEKRLARLAIQKTAGKVLSDDEKNEVINNIVVGDYTNYVAFNNSEYIDKLSTYYLGITELEISNMIDSVNASVSTNALQRLLEYKIRANEALASTPASGTEDIFGFTDEDYSNIYVYLEKANLGILNSEYTNKYTSKFLSNEFIYENIADSNTIRELIKSVNDEIVNENREIIANAVGNTEAMDVIAENPSRFFELANISSYNKYYINNYVKNMYSETDVNKLKTDNKYDISKIEEFIQNINDNTNIEETVLVFGDITWKVAMEIYSRVMSEDVALMYNTQILTNKTIGDYEVDLSNNELGLDNTNNIYKMLLLSRQIRDTYYIENISSNIDENGVYYPEGIDNDASRAIKSWDKSTFGLDYNLEDGSVNCKKYHEPDVVGKTYDANGKEGNSINYVYKRIYSFTGEQFFGGKFFANMSNSGETEISGIITPGTGYFDGFTGGVINSEEQLEISENSKVIFLNTSEYGTDWNEPWAYFFNDDKNWNKIKMEKTNKGLDSSMEFYVIVPEGATKVIFTQGNSWSSQTEDIIMPENYDGIEYNLSYKNSNGKYYCSNLVNSNFRDDEKYIYLDATNATWTNAYAYFGSNKGGKFIQMEKYTVNGKEYFRVEVPKGANNVQFRGVNNWSSGLGTLEIKLPSKGPKNQGYLYTITTQAYEDKWNYYSSADRSKVISAVFLTNGINYANVASPYPSNDDLTKRVLYYGNIEIMCKTYGVDSAEWKITSGDATENKNYATIINGSKFTLGKATQMDSDKKTALELNYKDINGNKITKYYAYRKLGDESNISISNVIKDDIVEYCGNMSFTVNYTNMTGVTYSLNDGTRISLANGQTISIGSDIADETKTKLEIRYTMLGIEKTITTTLYKRNVELMKSKVNYLSINTATNNSGFAYDNTLSAADNNIITVGNKGDIIKYILGVSINNVSYPMKVLEVQPVVGISEFDSYNGAMKLARYLGVNPVNDGMNERNYKEYFDITYMSVKEFNTRNDELTSSYDMIYFGINSGYQVVQEYTTSSGDKVYRTKYNDSKMNGLVYTGIGDKYNVFPFLRGTAAKDYNASSRKPGNTTRLNDYTVWENYFYDGFVGNSEASWNLQNTSKYYYLNNTVTTTRLSGNDITVKKMEELLQYLKSGYPILLADEILNCNDENAYISYNNNSSDASKWKYVDDNSKMYHFILEAKKLGIDETTGSYTNTSEFSDGKSYASLVSISNAKDGKNPDYLSTEDKFKGGLSFAYKRISRVGFSYKEGKNGPQEYGYDSNGNTLSNGHVGTVIKTTDDDYKTFNIILDINAKGGVSESELSNYGYNMYIDKSGVGKFEEDSTIELECEYEYVKNDNGNVIAVKVYGNWPGALEGFVPWKIEAYNKNNSENKFAYIGFSAFENSASAIKDVYLLWVKPNSGLTLDFNSAVKNNSDAQGNITSYKIHLITVDYATFNKVWAGENEYLSDVNKKYDSTTSLLKVKKFYGKGDTSKYYQMDDAENAKLTNDKEFDMIVIGYSDSHSEMEINSIPALKNIEYFVDAGHSLLFSHDNASYLSTINYYTNKDGKKVEGFGAEWARYTTSYLRKMLGMDQYGITYGGSNEELPKEYANARKYLDQSNESDFRGIIDMCAFHYSTGIAENNSLNNTSVYGSRLYSDTVYGTTPYKNGGNYITDWCHTKQIMKVNKGQVTEYPFVLNDYLVTGTTHSQYNTINLEDDDMTVWYVLDNDGTQSSSGSLKNPKYYSFTKGDGSNNYYIYSKGNITYTGAGHANNITAIEQKLFINTVIAALKAGNYEPEVKITNAYKSTATDTNNYINYYEDSTGVAVSFRAIDYDLKEGVQAFTNCKIYVDIDESGTYDPKVDIIINDPDKKNGYTTLMHKLDMINEYTNYVAEDIMNRTNYSFFLTNEDLNAIVANEKNVSNKEIYDMKFVVEVSDKGYLKASNPIPAVGTSSFMLVKKEATKLFNLN